MGRKRAVAVVSVASLIAAPTLMERVTLTTGRDDSVGANAPMAALSPSSTAAATPSTSATITITRVLVSQARVYCEDSESLTAVVTNSGRDITADVEFTIHDAAGGQTYQTVLPSVRLTSTTTAQALFPVIPCLDHGAYWLSVRVLEANGTVLATRSDKQAGNQYVVLTGSKTPQPTETPLPPIPIVGTVAHSTTTATAATTMPTATTRPSLTPAPVSATAVRLVFPFPVTAATPDPTATAPVAATAARLVFPFPTPAATPYGGRMATPLPTWTDTAPPATPTSIVAPNTLTPTQTATIKPRLLTPRPTIVTAVPSSPTPFAAPTAPASTMSATPPVSTVLETTAPPTAAIVAPTPSRPAPTLVSLPSTGRFAEPPRQRHE